MFAELLGGAEGAILPALYIILICSVLERFAPLERYSLAARVPGILMNAAQMVFSVALMWPQLAGLIAALVVLFTVAYVAFQRQEIRA